MAGSSSASLQQLVAIKQGRLRGLRHSYPVHALPSVFLYVLIWVCSLLSCDSNAVPGPMPH